MKWINHQILTGFIVYAVTDNALFVASSIVGAVIPDKVEGSPPKESKAYWAWRKRHRTWSHYPVLYIMLIGLLIFTANYFNEPTVSIASDIGIYILIGALLHIAEDGICGRVPIFLPKSKHGLKLFTVGSIGEYMFAALIIFICLFSRFGDSEKALNTILNTINNLQLIMHH